MTHVDIGSQILPDSFNALYHGLTAKDTLGTDFQSNSGDLGGECCQLLDHPIDSLLCQRKVIRA